MALEFGDQWLPDPGDIIIVYGVMMLVIRNFNRDPDFMGQFLCLSSSGVKRLIMTSRNNVLVT